MGCLKAHRLFLSLLSSASNASANDALILFIGTPPHPWDAPKSDCRPLLSLFVLRFYICTVVKHSGSWHTCGLWIVDASKRADSFLLSVFWSFTSVKILSVFWSFTSVKIPLLPSDHSGTHVDSGCPPQRVRDHPFILYFAKLYRNSVDLWTASKRTQILPFLLCFQVQHLHSCHEL